MKVLLGLSARCMMDLPLNPVCCCAHSVLDGHTLLALEMIPGICFQSRLYLVDIATLEVDVEKTWFCFSCCYRIIHTVSAQFPLQTQQILS